MEDNTPQITFGLNGITTQQYALIEGIHNPDNPSDFQLTFNFAKDNERRMVGVFSNFVFQQNEKTFLIIECGCHFEIPPESWGFIIQKDGSAILPQTFVTHLAMVTVGVTRGVLHSKLENTGIRVLIPLINITEVFKENLEMQ